METEKKIVADKSLKQVYPVSTHSFIAEYASSLNVSEYTYVKYTMSQVNLKSEVYITCDGFFRLNHRLSFVSEHTVASIDQSVADVFRLR